MEFRKRQFFAVFDKIPEDMPSGCAVRFALTIPSREESA